MEVKLEEQYYQQLVNQEEKIGIRYQAVFQLKNINNEEAIKKLIAAYPYLADSVLLSHEVLYALGQVDDSKIPIMKDFLIGVVDN